MPRRFCRSAGARISPDALVTFQQIGTPSLTEIRWEQLKNRVRPMGENFPGVDARHHRIRACLGAGMQVRLTAQHWMVEQPLQSLPGIAARDLLF